MDICVRKTMPNGKRRTVPELILESKEEMLKNSNAQIKIEMRKKLTQALENNLITNMAPQEALKLPFISKFNHFFISRNFKTFYNYFYEK